jgi:hypothetical protein
MCPSFTGAGRSTRLACHSPKVKAEANACERIRAETILREAGRHPTILCVTIISWLGLPGFDNGSG